MKDEPITSHGTVNQPSKAIANCDFSDSVVNLPSNISFGEAEGVDQQLADVANIVFATTKVTDVGVLVDS